MMVYRKGELSPSGVDRGWPHQVAVPATVSLGNGYNIVRDFCKDLSLCRRGHTVVHEGEYWNVYCFAKLEDAGKFRERFGGEKFDPAKRGKGRNWAEWKR